MAINVDRYYRGVAGENIRQLADRLLRLAQEAQHQAAYDAAFRLADAATQLLDVGSEVGVRQPLLANRKHSA